MCGIAGIINKSSSQLNATEIALSMSKILKHRGPDGEGLVGFSADAITPFITDECPALLSNVNYIPKINYSASPKYFAAFAHRRLAIIDLNATGHQPMCDVDVNVWITYNGEIYNYKEVKIELQKLGHIFVSESDTEVIINAYKQWGLNCVNHFNGMWAFCLYDKTKNTFFASRDRLGVKPFYYINNTTFFAFASEQKAFVKSNLVKATFNQKALHNYLLNDELENQSANFFEGINELMPGENIVYDYNTGSLTISTYFNKEQLPNYTNNKLSNAELVDLIKKELFNAITLRLRSDVEVGTCLSGGLDSSVIAGVMAQSVTKPINCFTSVFNDGAINEEQFADLVSKKINAKHFKTEPTVDEFENDFENLIYALDAPIWDTSTYAQFRVMKLAKEHGIKVVLDGQGADELFAGYHHHFISHWEQTIKDSGLAKGFSAISKSSISIPQPFKFFFKQKLKELFPSFTQNHLSLLKSDFVNANPLANNNIYNNNVNQQLLSDMGSKRLKSFLRCEDRCGMWHSVESRTPFSDDIGLMHLLFSFNGNRKIQNGISKYFLREAARTVLPNEVYTRYDKVGFETPMKQWVNQLLPQIFDAIEKANFSFVDIASLKKNYKPNSQNHIKLLFKLFVLAKWQKVFA